MRNITYFILIVFICLVSSTSHAWPARVVGVHDGDTITVEPLEGSWERVKVRLWGIDCPELDQPGGELARAAVNETLLFKTVDVREVNKDRYGRTVGTVYFTEKGNMYALQQELVRAGLAWVYPRYCKRKDPCERWKAYQEAARTNSSGLWQFDNPIAPWEWRKLKRGR